MLAKQTLVHWEYLDQLIERVVIAERGFFEILKNALLHFSRGVVGERDSEDVVQLVVGYVPGENEL